MKKIFELITNNPIGAAISTALAASLVGCAIFAFAAIVFSIYIPTVIRTNFYQQTGFYINAENVFVNILRGTIEIQNAHITSPEAYKQNNDFLMIENLKMNVDILPLVKPRFHIYKADMKISTLKTVRLSASRFNLRDFVEEMSKIVTFAPQNRFKGINIEIANLEYLDISEDRIRMNSRTDGNIMLRFSEPPSAETVRAYLKKTFESADASFMTTVLKLSEKQ